jgi:general secretion pathway protein G
MERKMNRQNDPVEHKRKKAGFTLLEIMVVIVILGILGAIVAPKFMDEPHKARVVKAKLQIGNLSTALNKFYLDNGFYPTTEQGLQALVRKPTVGRIPKNYTPGGYISKIPKDPWGEDYVYLSPGRHGKFDIISYGADGQEGGPETDADIQSWSLE